MGLVDCSIEEHVALVTFNAGENRFNPPFLEAFLNTLDDIEHDSAATTMVVTAAHEKIFCNGIDLEWLQPTLAGEPAAVKRFLYQLNTIFKRLVTYPLVTIAAISGHAFAGGAILCCAFDFRLMRSDRGYFCLPEVDLGIPFLPGMNALLNNAIEPWLLREMQLTGVRLTAEQCRAGHLVRQICPGDQLLEQALVFARSIHKKRSTVAELKKRLNSRIVHALDVEDAAYIETQGFTIL